MRSQLCAVFWAVLLGIQAEALGAEADRYAILVGVTDYPHLDPSLALGGSENDVDLVRQVLLESNFSGANIQLPTSQARSKPTKAGIFEAFARLEKQLRQREAGSEPLVYLHFSGHGAQQPAPQNSSEQDGYDEIFLPMDVKDWDFETKSVTNAITDDEIGELIEGLRATGAFVWVVFDACHSGTMTRSVSQAVSYRKLDRCALGIPNCKQAVASSTGLDFNVQSSDVQAKNSTMNDRGSDSKAGGLVAFYAAQSNETTPELYFPSTDKTDAKHGLFTYLMMQAISESSQLTYRQLAQKVIQKYNSYPWFESRPLFEGTGLDQYVFDQEQETRKQWPISEEEGEIRISAGALHGLDVGAIMAVFKNPNDQDEALLGYLEVTDVIRDAAELAPTAYGSLPAPDVETLKTGFYARVASARTSLRLAVAIHPDSDNQPALQRALLGLVDNGLSFKVDDVEAADLVLAQKSDRLWVLDPGQALPCALQTGIELETVYSGGGSGALNQCLADQNRLRYAYLDLESAATLPQVVSSSLQRVVRVRSILRLAGEPNAYNDRLDTRLDITRDGDKQVISTSGDVIPMVFNNDGIQLAFTNRSYSPADVSLFFIGSDYSITQVYPALGESARVLPQDSLNQFLGNVTATTVGREYLVLVANEVGDDTVTSDNSFLQQPGLSTQLGSEVRKRKVGALSPIEQLWDASVTSGQADIRTRSFNQREKKSGTLKVFSWQTAP